MKKKTLCIPVFFVFIILMLTLSACESKKEENTTTQDYVYTPSGENSVSNSSDAKINGDGVFAVDNSWKSNFDVKYTYYNKEQSEELITVREKKSENYFSAEDIESGDMLYYKGGEQSVDSYVIVKGETEQVHSEIKNKTLDDLSSTYMKLTDIDEDLPSMANVMFMYEDTVAGRTCLKYIQRAYTDGDLTKSVYVWVDKEYGFALKGEVYDEDDVLTASWETLDFSAGNITDSDVLIDISQYKITEE